MNAHCKRSLRWSAVAAALIVPPGLLHAADATLTTGTCNDRQTHQNGTRMVASSGKLSAGGQGGIPDDE